MIHTCTFYIRCLSYIHLFVLLTNVGVLQVYSMCTIHTTCIRCVQHFTKWTHTMCMQSANAVFAGNRTVSPSFWVLSNNNTSKISSQWYHGATPKLVEVLVQNAIQRLVKRTSNVSETLLKRTSNAPHTHYFLKEISRTHGDTAHIGPYISGSYV